MSKLNFSGSQLFVLDTNVLIHDPTAIFRFKTHDIFIPMVVLEELDNGKKGLSEPARAIRQTNRFLEKLLANNANRDLSQGVPLVAPEAEGCEAPLEQLGHLFFQTEELSHPLPASLPGNKSDNSILSVTLALMESFPKAKVTLVSKDINLRIKSSALSIHTEDYYSERVLDDTSVMHSGMTAVPEDFWDTHGQETKSWQSDAGRTLYAVQGPMVEKWAPQQALYSEADASFEAFVRQTENSAATLEYAKDYRKPSQAISGITARNREQNFALNMLMDPDIDFVSLLGPAGTGKTLLTLAAAVAQTVRSDRFREIIITRITVPLGEDIGFLPGSEEEKMTPWMGAFLDNLEILYPDTPILTAEDGNRLLIENQIRIRSLNFMRGRTFLNKFIIIDEAQNLTPKQMQALITRAGPGTKVVCLGNTAQIDTPYLTETTSGLTYAVNQFRQWDHSGHIVLTQGERSRLAAHASDVL